MTLPRRFWQDMTTVEFAALEHARVIALLPVAAIEQHGPHLPVSVDARINQGVLDCALARMPADLPVTVLPAMPIGKSDEHGAFPGTLTLSSETLIRLWSEIGDSVARSGIRKFVLFNSHGGQPQILDLVAGGLRARHRMLAVAVNAYRLFGADSLFPADELRHGIHGGAIETSIMLHLAPDQVRLEQAQNFGSLSQTMAPDYRWLSPIGRMAPFAWQAQDLNPAAFAAMPPRPMPSRDDAWSSRRRADCSRSCRRWTASRWTGCATRPERAGEPRCGGRICVQNGSAAGETRARPSSACR